MIFEYDHVKNAANLAKHGIDFDAAGQLWLDPELIEVQARSSDEPRSMIIGRIGSTHWSAVITYRGPVVRIISVRRSRVEEVRRYEGQ